MLTPADEVEILTASRGAGCTLPSSSHTVSTRRAALAAVGFVTRVRALDKWLRLAVDREMSGANGGELLLVFAPVRGGSLAAEWLEEVKPLVRELAVAEFEGAELKSVEVVAEDAATRP